MTIFEAARSAPYSDNGRRSDFVVGVELGGTKCVCVLATVAGESVEQVTIATTLPDQTLAAIDAVLDRWWRAPGFTALGVASFGPVDLDPASPTYGHITATSKPKWSHTDVGVRLSSRFGVPMVFDTDVNGAAIAEQEWGAAQGLDNHAYITVGTGVGVGLVVHGRPTRGIGHCELGHIRVPRIQGDSWPGSCPFHGDCVEGLASGTAIKARLGSKDVGTIGEDADVWHSVVDALAQLCHVLVLATGPRRILIGGGVATGQPHLLPRIEARLRTSLAGYIDIPKGDADRPYICAPAMAERAGPMGPIAMAIALVRNGARAWA